MDNTLITISKSIHDAVWLYERLAYASAGDGILLISEAVNDLNSSIALASFLAKANASGVSIFALKEDVAIRAVSCQYEEIGLVDYDEFVALCIRYDTQVAW